jgi:hypothetical protein
LLTFTESSKEFREYYSPQGISTDPEKLKAVRECPTPKNKHEIRSLLSLCTYYRLFISGFANIEKPLSRFTEEKQAFQWTQELNDSFQTLMGALFAAPFLSYSKPGEKFIVDTDASNFGIGGVLSQIQDGRNDVEILCRECDACSTSRGPRTMNRCQIDKYNVGAPFVRIAIDVGGPFTLNDKGNKYLLNAIDYFTK